MAQSPPSAASHSTESVFSVTGVFLSLEYQVTPVNALLHAEVAIDAINHVLLARLLKEQQEENHLIRMNGYVCGSHWPFWPSLLLT